MNAPASHLHLNAATARTTDRGTFTAVVSTEDVDRGKDITTAGAMVTAFKRWADRGRPIPLHWNHGTAPEDIIGTVDPSTAVANQGRVLCSGRVDLQTRRGREAWRLVKSGVVGLSFGYLTGANDTTKGADGIRRIHNLDLFEITLTAQPMNAATRVVGWKSLAIARRFADERTRALKQVDQIERRLTLEDSHRALSQFETTTTQRDERALQRVDELEAQMQAEDEARSWQRLMTKHLRRNGYID